MVPAISMAKPAKPAARIDWSHVVAATAGGGFVMGNPKAKVKLIEFGSLTCPHCRKFDEDGVSTLVGKYVKSGAVSWEFRNYVRDPFDLSAALIARCNGAGSFFPLMRALFKDQPTWIAKIQAADASQIDALRTAPPSRQFVGFAKVAGLQAWGASHGVQVARSNQCLSNGKSVDQLVQITKKAMSDYPDFAGTPTFVINGAMVQQTATWDQLEPKLKQALGS